MKFMRYIAALSALVFMFSCKKNKDVPATPPTTPPVVVTQADLEKDTALSYSRDIYLWYDQIPSTFNARSYADPSAIMTAIRQYSKEPNFTSPVDRFSFAAKKVDWDKVSSGVQQDFGMSVFFNDPTDLRVKYVERSSPAGVAGIQRGWQITKINGSTAIDTSAASINMIVAAVFQSNSTSFTFKKPDGTTKDITVNAGTYQTHPVFFDSVYTVNSSKVGYMVFQSFLGDTTEIYNEFNRVFTKFSANNVTNVVIDLRYNGGGYVSVAEKLVNYLVPSTANGQILEAQTYNNKYSQYNVTATVKKIGSLNAPNVFFIGSSSTASASELVINAMKPYANVKIVGPNSTYGKPVGFFPIPVGSWYIFPVSFRTVNKNGDGSYFNGFAPDKAVKDGVAFNWGDPNESCLKSILTYVGTGVFGRILPNADRPVNIQKNLELDHGFKGTVSRPIK